MIFNLDPPDEVTEMFRRVAATVAADADRQCADLAAKMGLTSDLTKQLTVEFSASSAKAFEAIANLFASQESSKREGTIFLFQCGWMPHWEMPVDVTMIAPAHNREEVDEYMAEFLSERIDAIRKEVVSRLPEREAALREAFDAHAQGHYFSSVAVLMSQVDGACMDAAQKSIFKKVDQKPEIAQALPKFESSSVFSWLAEPLTRIGPINANTDHLDPADGHLNRHAVLHGLDKSYGSKINSLKAVSLINFVATVLLDTLAKTE